MFLRLIFILAGCVTVSSAVEPAALFDSHGCRSCHKIGERGGNSGPDLTMVGHRRPRAWIEKWLASPRAYKHDTKMPEQGLPVADRAALANFLSELKGQAWGDDPPWIDHGDHAPDGRRIYVRAGCIACHGPAGRGGHPNPGGRGGWIPALPPLLATYKKDELISKLKRGAKADAEPGRVAEVDMPGWDKILSAADLEALVDYLLTLASAGPKDGNPQDDF
ncbi:MAG: c-type cytochrome [Elusimicrobia bacterium]|nr:c-type cytochrome [Elusimicrobiota bacterium]